MPLIINGIGDVVDPNNPSNDPNENYTIALKSELDSLEKEVEKLKETVGLLLSSQGDYFNSAASFILTLKANTQNYPNSISSLRSQDDQLILNGGYIGLNEDNKATLLINAVRLDLSI